MTLGILPRSKMTLGIMATRLIATLYNDTVQYSQHDGDQYKDFWHNSIQHKTQ